MDDRRVLIGQVVGVAGVAGQVKIHSFTEPRENIFRYRPWILVHEGRETAVERPQGRAQGKGMVATLPGIADRDRALAMMGADIFITRAQLPRAKPGEYYWADLEGLAVSTLEGVALGTVAHLFSTGANDVIVVRGDRERLLPYIHGQVVHEIDLDARTMRVDWDPDF